MEGGFQSKLNGKVVQGQTREVIANVMEFMEREARADRFLIDPKKVRERVSVACGVSLRTLTRLKAEKRKIQNCNGSFETPNKKRILPKRVTGLDRFDMGAIRRIVNNIYLTEKCLPTLQKIKDKLATEVEYSGSVASVRVILKTMGYRWKKTKSNKHILMESHDVSYKRFVFLKKIQEYRRLKRPIVYTDESYIDSSHVSGKGCFDDSEGVAAPVSKGERLIFLHAGGEMGFIPNCLMISKASKKTGDYRDNVNSATYIKWVTEQLIPNLPPHSIVVLDNASYHNKQEDKCPTSNSTKSDMQLWLTRRNIPFSSNMFKEELYNLIERNKPSKVRYVVDEIFNSHGHEVLRLPPFHPELNAFKLVWAEVKNWVAANNVAFSFKEVEELARKKLDTITAADWTEKCEIVQNYEKNFMTNLAKLEAAMESFNNNLGADSNDDENSDFSDNQSDIYDNDIVSGDEELE